jgi:hypothetical protein
MQIKQIENPKSALGGLFSFIFLICFPFTSNSQTTYLPQGAEENILIERMEIKAQKDSVLNFSKTRPFDRRIITATVLRYNTGTFKIKEEHPDLSKSRIGILTRVDQYNAQRVLMNNIEWVPNGENIFKSKKPWGKTFYQTPGTLYEVHSKDFDLAINPVLQFQLSKENNNDETLFLNSRGVRVRGKIANKIGFDSYLTDNQERDPLYVQQW